MERFLSPYRDWSPPSFDVRGLSLPGMQDWLVCPCIQTRDSKLLTRSNFEAQADALAVVAEADNDMEFHTFGHWGPGWIEIVLVRPGSKAAEVAGGLAAALSAYPILDEAKHSSMEWDEINDFWFDMGIGARHSFIQYAVESGRIEAQSMFALRRLDSEVYEYIRSDM